MDRYSHAPMFRRNPLGAKVRPLSMASDLSCSLKDSNLVDKYVDGTNPQADICTSEVSSEIRLSERSASDVPGKTESQPTALPLQQVSKLDVKGVETSGESSASSVRKAGPSEFELLKVIGMGAFGKVLQVRSTRNGQILAMKCISKKMLARRNHIAYMQAERDIMTKVMHPFVVTLQCAFQTKHKLFLVMEYLPGGELFFHLEKKGLFLEEYARFYAAEMVLALEHLHSKGIIHRDLKPENLLLGANGHICLTDFGLAKELTDAEDEGLKTICGTNEYMAPEMILRKGYGKAVDWWSMGALVYEMTSGYPPFRGKTPRDLNRKILNERVSLPKWLSPTAHQVLRGFLERNVSSRLGAKKTTMFEIGGATAVKQHPFFAGIDWAKLVALQLDPPLKPDISSATDTSNFSTEFLEMALPRSLSHESMLSQAESLEQSGDQGDKMFRGFSFVADSFIETADWQSGEEGDGFIFTEGNRKPNATGEGTSPTGEMSGQKKKVKGKRIRHKKGKAKDASSVRVVTEENESVTPTAKRDGDGAPSPLVGASRIGSVSVVPGRPKLPPREGDDLFVRQPVVGAESKPSALAAMLADQTRGGSSSQPVPRGTGRPNVWGARELPAPAPVPTPAGPPRGQIQRSFTRGAKRGTLHVSDAERRLPGGVTDALPGYRGQGNTFVWKRPV